jgi:hypothetical protein
MRKLLLSALAALLLIAAAPKKKSGPAPAAPSTISHTNALFLGDLSNDGKKQITFRATAVGTRFFFEEPAGVTVYRYANGNYVKEEFVRNAKIPSVVKRYAKR